MRQALVLLFVTFALISCNRSRYNGPPEPRVAPSTPLVSYADMVDHVAPAVVTIRASRRVRAPQQFPFFDDPFFRQFFGGTAPRQPQTQVQRALGSGVIVQADGHILTNHHVIDGAEDIRVDLNTRQSYSAKLVGSDPPSDLAVLKISASGLPVLQLADSDKVRVGDVCLAVGNPLGIGESVTAGIVSAKGRATGISDGSFQDFLQTDAPINQGNSGGALVNTRGELIGINSQILSPNGGGNIGIGFAIPSNMAKSVMGQLIGKGAVHRGMIGVTIQPMTSDLAQGLGMKEAKGVLISGVNPGGPAEKAGLQSGDVILKVNGRSVNDPNELRNTVAGQAPGSEVTVTVSRNGNEQDFKVKLGELGSDVAQAGGSGGGGGAQGAPALGVGVVPLTPDVAADLGLRRGTQGVVIQSVEPGGPAAEAGLQPGDVIQEVNRQPVRSPQDMRAALQKSGNRTPVLLINRRGQTQYVPVPVR
jgi:Do/DeqQ family serine protease